MNRFRSGAEDAISMDIYSRTSHKIKGQEERKTRKIKMLKVSSKPRPRKDKHEISWDQISTKGCKHRTGLRSSKMIRQVTKKPNKPTRLKTIRRRRWM